MKRRSEKGEHVPGNGLRMKNKFAIRVNSISSNLKRSNVSNPVWTRLEMFGAGKFTILQPLRASFRLIERDLARVGRSMARRGGERTIW